MVVMCPSCGNRFRLDETLLSGAAGKVRCSLCQHVFEVMPPQPEHTAAASSILDLGTPEERDTAFEPPPAPETAPAAPEPSPPAAPKPPASPAAPPAPDPQSSRRSLVLAIVGGIFLGLVLAILSLWYVGAFKWGVLPPALLTSERVIIVPQPLPAGPEEIKGLSLEPGEARYRGLVSKKGGPLLVIQGEVENNTPDPRGPIRLKATLTDDRDRTVGERLFYSGTTLSDQELRDLDPAEINRWLDAPGGRDQAPRLLPGHKQPFTVVFFGVPADLAAARYGFTVAVDQGPRAPNP